MPFLMLPILFYECPKTGLHASKVKKHFKPYSDGISFTVDGVM